MAKVAFNQDIDEQVAQKFSAVIDERGYTKYRAVEGALRAFMALPQDVQVSLMSNSTDPYQLLIDTFRDIGLQEDLQKLSPDQRRQIIEMAKQSAKKVSRKK